MKTLGTCNKDPQVNSAHRDSLFIMPYELGSSEIWNIIRAVSKYLPQDNYAPNDPRDKFAPFPVLTLNSNTVSA